MQANHASFVASFQKSTVILQRFTYRPGQVENFAMIRVQKWPTPGVFSPKLDETATMQKSEIHMIR